MIKRNGMLGPYFTIPVVVGFALLIVMAFFNDTKEMEAGAAQFYEFTDISVTKDDGVSVLGNGSFISPLDLINITANNESIPANADDILVIDLYLNDEHGDPAFNTTFNLTYSVSGDTFWGNISLEENMDSNITTIPGGIKINVSDGYSLKIKKHNEDETWMTLTIDTNAPVIEMFEPSSSFTSHNGVTYSTTTSTLNFIYTDDDPNSTSSMAVSNGWVKYSWNGNSEQTWDGTDFAVPSSIGKHVLKVNATDGFGQYIYYTFEYHVAETITDTSITDSVSYTNKTILSPSIIINSGGSLNLENCTLLTLDAGDTITVRSGGYLNITGPDNDTSQNRSIVSSAGNGMTIISLPGSNFYSFGTEYIDNGSSPNQATLSLWEGEIYSSMISSANTAIYIRSIGVTVKNTTFTGNNTPYGIMIDVEHEWSEDNTSLSDLYFKGTFKTPIRVINNSVWKPFDVDQIYYLDEGNVTLSFNTPGSEAGYSDPYLYLPHFLDSRSSESKLYITYFDSTEWVMMSGSYLSDTIFSDWVNGEDALIDLSSIPQGSRVNITFNASENLDGRLYTGVPYIGGSNMDPVRITSTNFAGFTMDWLSQPVDGYTLFMDNISMENATERFLDIESSGFIWINDLKTGTGTLNPEIVTQIEVDHGSIILNNSNLKGNDDLSNFIHSHMYGENDYPVTKIMGTSLSSYGDESMTGVRSDTVWLDVRNLSIKNVSYGIRGKNSIIATNRVDIEATSYGIHMELPDTFEENVDLALKGISVSGDLRYGGIHIEGDTDYKLDIMLTDFDIASTYNSTTFQRNDGYGGIILDLESSEKSDIHIKGSISEGPWHGIAINTWPSEGMIEILKGTMSSNMDLDGIWFGTGIHLRINDGVNINGNGGWGIYSFEESNITMAGLSNSLITLRNNDLGGITTMDSSIIEMDYTDISFNDGYAIDMGKAVTASISNLDAQGNNYGVRALTDSSINFISSSISGTLTGDGLYMEEVDLVLFGTTLKKTTILENNKRGVFMDGGTLQIGRTRTDGNGMDGISLQGVDVRSFSNVTSSGNGGDGLVAHVDGPSLLDVEGKYFKISSSRFDSNLGKGLTVTTYPTAGLGEVSIELEKVKIYNNTGGDIISGPDVLYTWNMKGADQLGTPEFRGQTIANMKITVLYNQVGIIFNEDLFFLDSDTRVEVEDLGTMVIEDSTIKPVMSSDRWSFIAGSGSRITITGCYLTSMENFDVYGAASLTIKETQFINNNNGLTIEDAGFTIDSCHFSNTNGNSIMLKNSHGTISNSGIRGSSRGILVNGLTGSLKIDNTVFSENSWGLYVFKSDVNSTITVTDSVFEEGRNWIAPIWTRADITLQDTEIDPDDIIVDSDGTQVRLFYTLTVNVIDEEEKGQKFDINLKIGQSPSSIISNDNDGTWSQSFRSYLVTDTDVDRSRESLRLLIAYPDTFNDDSKEGYIKDSLVLDRTTIKTYYGYEKPFLTPLGKEHDIIYAEEDSGLVGGPLDISGWFSDIGSDKGNLSYSADSLTDEIEVTLIGPILSLQTEENWNGHGKIQITVSDPHGKESVFRVNVDVRPKNDLPWITEPMINVIKGDDNIPRSGDSIRATWKWHDIDEGDSETYIRIEWYLNGTLVEDFRNSTVVTNVKAGQIWNFKIWPSDQDTPNTGQYGEPVSSPPVIVKSIPPKWTSDLTVNSYTPTTDKDIIVSPGTFDDPDSSLVTYNYLWEVKKGNIYTPIGAPNSPILDHRFTSKHQDIRVKVWLSDGDSISEVKTALFKVRNSAPVIVSASISPKLVREYDDMIRIKDVVTYDADGDQVTLYYEWRISDISVPINNEIPYLTKIQGSWSYPSRANITAIITCFDSDNQEGESLTLTANFLPTDTDGDGLFDDANGNGINDPGDDKDDDNDGFLDEWEIFLGTDPLDPLSTPLDTDGDGIPDGDAENSQIWMDRDDDGDGIEDSIDPFPKIAALPGDFDGDGIGDDRDPDIDGDGVPNEEDYDPYNPNVSDPPETDGQSLIEIFIFILLILILLAIGIGIFAVASGKVKLPTTAPPDMGIDDGAEAIFEEDDHESKTAKGEDLDELEDLDNMSVCSVCGEIINMDEENCPNCGAVFDSMEEDDMEFEEDDDN